MTFERDPIREGRVWVWITGSQIRLSTDQAHRDNHQTKRKGKTKSNPMYRTKKAEELIINDSDVTWQMEG